MSKALPVTREQSLDGQIVESEKPVFTLIFGGVAAFASAIYEAAKPYERREASG
jgi:hypothetical protein